MPLSLYINRVPLRISLSGQPGARASAVKILSKEGYDINYKTNVYHMIELNRGIFCIGARMYTNGT